MNSFQPATKSGFSAADMPVAVARAVSGAARLFHVLIVGVGMAAVGLSGTAALAQQGVTAGVGQMGPGQRAPLATQAEPPTLTPAQELLREEAMERANQPGPLLPSGPETAPLVVPETGPGASLAPSIGGGPSGAPGTLRYFESTGHGPYSTGTSITSETHVGTAGHVVFQSGNWFASYSTDGGESFSFVNPYTQFPALDAGFCCDQTVIYDRTRDQMIWQLQYSYSATTQRGSYRIAFAPSASVASAGWCYYDFNPGSFGLAAGLWLDYPNVALSNNFVWYTVNVYDNSSPPAWQRTLIFRIPLAQASTCSAFTYNYFVVSDRFNFTPTQGATSTMYWASHNSTSSVRVFRWAENSGTIFWDDVGISTWPRTLPYQCPGPDGLNWCGRNPNDGRIQTGWVAGGVIGFMWNAGQGTNRPYPYVHVARFNESNRALINEPILWSTVTAWAFPAIGVNARGHLAGSVYFGGGSFYPTMTAFIWDDFSSAPPPWEVYSVVASARGATNSWGDWYSTRRHGVLGNTWVTSGQELQSTGTVRSRYLWFGRERDRPPSDTPDLLGGFSTGTWQFINNASWQRITTAVPGLVGAGDLDGNLKDEAIGSFPSGVWAHYNNTTWVNLTTATAIASAVGDLDGSGRDDFIGSFGNGTWVYFNGSGWVRVTTAVASALATGDLDGNGKADLIGSFASGTWVLYNNASWVKRNNAGAVALASGDLDASGRDEIVAGFSGSGTWVFYNNATWTKRNNATATELATGDIDASGRDDVIGSFSSGTWVYYNNATWGSVTTATASDLATGDLDGSGRDDILASYGNGTWVYYNNASWVRRTTAVATDVASGGLD